MRHPTGLVFSEAFLEPGIPRDESSDLWNVERLKLVWSSVRAAVPDAPLLPPRPATDEELALVHDPAYIALIRDYSSGARQRGDDFRHVSPDTAITSNTFALASLAAGAVITAADAVERGEVGNAVVIARPGDHHAYPARGEGFCVFNHTAIGARHVQRQYDRSPVLILDWDVHHCNGTQAIFSSDPTVLTFSTHSFGSIYPRTGARESRGSGPGRGTKINVPLDPGTTDRQFRAAFLRGLREIRVTPAFVFLVAGFDAHREDPVGNLRLSDDTFDWLTTTILDLAREWCDGRVVSVLAGGYNLDTLGPLAAAHVRLLATHGLGTHPPPLSP